MPSILDHKIDHQLSKENELFSDTEEQETLKNELTFQQIKEMNRIKRLKAKEEAFEIKKN